MAPIRSSTLLIVSIIVALPANSFGSKNDAFLGGPSSDHVAQDEAFRSAMAAVIGCGDQVSEAKSDLVKSELSSIWDILPKNRYGRLEWRLFRYIVHRYFLQKSSLMVRGLEPSLLVNESHTGIANLISHEARTLIEGVLESKRFSNGFSLEDAATMVLALEQLIREQERDNLEMVYKKSSISMTVAVSHDELVGVIEKYMAYWLIGEGDPKLSDAVLTKQIDYGEAIEQWSDVREFAHGVVKTMEWERQRIAHRGHARVALTHTYSFDEARDAIADITRSFASYWETECQVIKASLISMDKDGTGRVALSDFYGDGQWRFAESEAYLRELGALDESLALRGTQVIIPNYLQGASNCIVSTEHYKVCCVKECASVLNDIEDTIGTPVATPAVILPLVGNMTDYNDDKPKLDVSLTRQLNHIAEIHGGKVPLHGRLFSQWLHFVFPRECPFPHKTGTTSAVAPSEFGDDFMATAEEVNAAKRQVFMEAKYKRQEMQRKENLEFSPSEANASDNALWMSQFSEEEELLADYSAHLRSPWDGAVRRIAMAGGATAFMALMWIGAIRGTGEKVPLHIGGATTEPRRLFI